MLANIESASTPDAALQVAQGALCAGSSPKEEAIRAVADLAAAYTTDADVVSMGLSCVCGMRSSQALSSPASPQVDVLGVYVFKALLVDRLEVAALVPEREGG